MNTDKKKQFIINALYIAIIAIIVLLIMKYCIPHVTPFIIGFIVAFALQKPIKIISGCIGRGRKFVAIFFVLLFYSTIGVALTLLSIYAWSAVENLVLAIPDMYNNWVLPALVKILNSFENMAVLTNSPVTANIETINSDLISSVTKLVTDSSALIIKGVTGAAISIPSILINVIVTIISTLFIAIDYDKIVGFCKKQLKPKAAELIGDIKEYVVGTLWVCLRSYLIIMSITFVELSIGLTIIGIENSILIALGIAIFDILPVLGTGGIMIPWTIICLILGDIRMAVGLGLLYLTITAIRNIIEPKIVGSQLGLHPIATLSSMFLGIGLCGGIGLFGFPITLSLICYLNREGTIHILNLDE